MTYKVCVSVCVSGWELQTCSQEMNINFSKAYKQTGKERTEDWRWSSSRLVLCPAHSRGSQEERDRASMWSKACHTRSQPGKDGFSVIGTSNPTSGESEGLSSKSSEYTWRHKGSGFCVCAFTQWRIPSCFDLGWIKRLKTNEEMLIWKMRIIWICY